MSANGGGLLGNLIWLYHVMIASENLLAVAALKSDGDLERYFCAHLEEERGHAKWLAEDLLSVGIRAERTKLPREAVEMVGSVYYLIFHADPVALLGYMHVLESWPLKANLVDWEKQYPASLLRTLKFHAEHDPDHLAALERVIEALPPQRRMLVEQTKAVTIDHLRRSAAYLTG